jgi:hypothetical protein
MTKNVAVEGAVLTIIGATGGSAVITSSPGNAKADDKGVFTGNVDVLVSGTTSGTCVQGASKTGQIQPTGSNKLDDKIVVREEDETSTISIDGTDSGSGLACSYSVTAKITNAGQVNNKSD